MTSVPTVLIAYPSIPWLDSFVWSKASWLAYWLALREKPLSLFVLWFLFRCLSSSCLSSSWWDSWWLMMLRGPSILMYYSSIWRSGSSKDILQRDWLFVDDAWELIKMRSSIWVEIWLYFVYRRAEPPSEASSALLLFMALSRLLSRIASMLILLYFLAGGPSLSDEELLSSSFFLFFYICN